MKKLIIAIATLAMLTACGTAQTIVVDQNGKVIETKNSFQGLVYIGELPVDNQIDGQMYQDTVTGCKYAMFSSRFFPYYNADGQVDGCKNITKGVSK
jgi:hypothetical protein